MRGLMTLVGVEMEMNDDWRLSGNGLVVKV